MNRDHKFRKYLQAFFHFFGFEISRYPPRKKLNKRDEHFLKLLKKYEIDLVLDVGAAEGAYANWLFDIGYVNTVLAFEPLPEQYIRLENLSRTNPRLKLADRCALGDVEKSIKVNISGNLGSSSILTMLDAHRKAAPLSVTVSELTVPQCRLDSFAKQIEGLGDHVFLKIDVQGYEKLVLEGAERILPGILGIQVEMSLVPLYEGQVLFEELYFYLKSMGFELFYVRPGFADLSGRLLQLDGIFFRV